MKFSDLTNNKIESASEVQVIIKPRQGLLNVDFRELWVYRELFWFLALRDVLIRYKQAAIGITWSIIQPVFTMIVFSVIFGGIAKLPSDGAPYPLMVFTALLPWQFFANSMRSSSSSVVGKATILTKIYFPRLIIPTSAVITGVIDFSISFAILLSMMAWYRIIPTINILFLPLFLLLAFMSALGIGLWLSALNVEFRDVVYTVPFIIQAGQYISPVAYTSSLVPERWQLLYSLNPMVGVINGFRWAILGTTSPDWGAFLVSGLGVLILFVSGLFYFQKRSGMFADII